MGQIERGYKIINKFIYLKTIFTTHHKQNYLSSAGVNNQSNFVNFDFNIYHGLLQCNERFKQKPTTINYLH